MIIICPNIAKVNVGSKYKTSYLFLGVLHMLITFFSLMRSCIRKIYWNTNTTLFQNQYSSYGIGEQHTVLKILLDYNIHQPKPMYPIIRNAGRCQPHQKAAICTSLSYRMIVFKERNEIGMFLNQNWLNKSAKELGQDKCKQKQRNQK